MTQNETAPLRWDDLESLLEQSLSSVRRESLPRVQPAATVAEFPNREQPHATAPESPLAHLIADCGIAAIDGYLRMREYAASKGLDLVEIHHKGIDLQDLVSTLVIHQQRTAELETRVNPGRYKQ